MAIADQVADVFFSARIDRIDFRLGPIEVSPKRLRSVGRAIRKGDISIESGTSGRLLSAAYSPHSNRMAVPQTLGSVMSQASILHEGVHALVDMFRCTQATVLDDEAAASPRPFICAPPTPGSAAPPRRSRSTRRRTPSPGRTASTTDAASR